MHRLGNSEDETSLQEMKHFDQFLSNFGTVFRGTLLPSQRWLEFHYSQLLQDELRA